MLKRIKTKKKYNICKMIVLSSLITSFALNDQQLKCVNAEEVLNNLDSDYTSVFKYENGEEISILIKENKILIKKTSVERELWNKEVVLKDNLYFNSIKIIEDAGFVVINNYCNNEFHKSNLPTIENSVHECDENSEYNLIALNNEGDVLLNEDTINLSDEYFDKFVEDVFLVKFDSFEDRLNSFSQEELYLKALELITIAEDSLNADDIKKASLAIYKISDDATRESLLTRLNVISNESINNEINESFNGDFLDDSATSLSTSSEITLSVHTNNLTFDYLNISEDTILHKAITLNVTSSLIYDINMYIEGGIISETNTTNLKNNVFSVKESSKSDFITFGDDGKVTVISSNPAGATNTHNLDVKLNTGSNVIRDIYKTVFKVEAITK